MSVETTTGSSDAIGGIESAVSETVARAEQVLSHRFGATIGWPTGASRWQRQVDRGAGPCRVLTLLPPAHPRGEALRPGRAAAGRDAFVQEAVSYQLFTAFSPEDRMCPEMFAHDGAARLVVLGGPRRAPTLENKAAGHDAKAAERALLSWSRSLGRLHASTAGRRPTSTRCRGDWASRG